MKTWISAIFFILIFIAKAASGQNMGEPDSLNYTYIGPVLSLGYNKVEYKDWFFNSTPTGSTETKKMSGYIASGGVTFNIFADEFCGDLQIKYAKNNLENTLQYIEVSAAGKYFFYKLNDFFSLGGGLGLYLELSSPSAEQNGSAGLQLPFTILIETSRDTKLFIDLYFRYGSFGIGENTKSISAGANLGFIFKVGRI
ncbi:MAG: hypothetical protein FWG49_03875 [Leptospirales bacterium]|nr:hypothetical protein [Leptospirales bacterium]